MLGTVAKNNWRQYCSAEFPRCRRHGRWCQMFLYYSSGKWLIKLLWKIVVCKYENWTNCWKEKYIMYSFRKTKNGLSFRWNLVEELFLWESLVKTFSCQNISTKSNELMRIRKYIIVSLLLFLMMETSPFLQDMVSLIVWMRLMVDF